MSFKVEIPCGLFKLQKQSFEWDFHQFNDLVYLRNWVETTPNWQSARVVSISGASMDHTSLLAVAVIHHKVGAVQLFLEKGADPNQMEDFHQTVLQQCVRNHHTAESRVEKTEKIVDLLLTYGADIDATDKNGRTALHFVFGSEQDNCHFLRMLLERGADTTVRERHGRTPLMVAVKTSRYAEMAILLEPPWAVDIHARDFFGATALAYAADYKNMKACRLLLDHGARVVDDNNATSRKEMALNLLPLAVAMKRENVELTYLLLQQVVQARAQPFAWLNDLAQTESCNGNPLHFMVLLVRYHAPWNQYRGDNAISRCRFPCCGCCIGKDVLTS